MVPFYTSGWWCSTGSTAGGAGAVTPLLGRGAGGEVFMALSTYMFNNTMQGYHHRGLIQNHGLLGQQGSPTAPTDHQWIGTFQALHTQTINTTGYAEDFFVRAGASGSFFPNPFYSSSTQNDINYEVIPTAGTATESPYECPVDWRNAKALLKVVNDSIVFNGPDSLAYARLAKLEVYKAVRADSILQTDAALVAFADSFALTDLAQLDYIAAQLRPGLPDSVARAFADKVGSVSASDAIAGHWRKILIHAFSKWADEDSTTNFDSSDSTLLKEIALLCPFTSGPAVSLARTLLFSPTKEYFSLYNECEIPAFTPPSSRFGQEPISDKGPQISITPNPTTGIIQVNATGYDITTLQWQVTDLTGKSLLAGRFRNMSIDLSTLDPGTYLVRISNQGTTEFSTKVVLIRP